MIRVTQISLCSFLLVGATAARAEIEIMTGNSQAAVLGNGQSMGILAPFPEQKVRGDTVIVQGLVRPFPLKQFGFGLRWQDSSFRSFRANDSLRGIVGSDAIYLRLISPVVGFQFETISDLSVRLSLSYFSGADVLQTENAQSQSYRGSSGYHYALGAAYRVTESNQLTLQYSYETVAIKPNGNVIGTRLTQINPNSFLLGFTFGA